jgi:hypothetical protein
MFILYLMGCCRRELQAQEELRRVGDEKRINSIHLQQQKQSKPHKDKDIISLQAIGIPSGIKESNVKRFGCRTYG